jgi:hypothetical protein
MATRPCRPAAALSPGSRLLRAAPVVYEKQPVYCEWRRQKVWIDSYTYQVRRVRVCN